MERVEGVDVLCRPQDSNVLLVAVGPLAAIALTAAARLRERGVAVAVVDPRWVLPVPEQVVKLASDVELVVTLEESGLHSGVGSAVAAGMREARIDTGAQCGCAAAISQSRLVQRDPRAPRPNTAAGAPSDREVIVLRS